MTHDCAHQGHVWVEPDGTRYVRHRDRPKQKVAVTCLHCPATADLPMHGKATAPPLSGPVLMR